jgi:hypothetical protein
MYHISDQQIDYILTDIRAHGIRTESIRDNLLDHICILIEENLEEGGNFEAFYASVIPTFYRQELREIEEEARFLVDRRRCLALSKTQFFLLVFAVVIGPFIGYDLNWLANAHQTGGLALPSRVWEGTMVFATFPLLCILAAFLTPERFDPLIPNKSTILLGARPFIRIVPPENFLGMREG